MKTPIVRAIDIGYGFTKYIKNSDCDTNHIEFGIFPSLTNIVAVGNAYPQNNIIENKNVIVEANGAFFEVGPDAPTLTSLHPHHTRVLHEDYCKTDTYLALLRAALSYIDVPQIDILVLGLPAGYINFNAPKMMTSLKGIHPLANEKHVNVREIVVIPQPMGGFLSYADSFPSNVPDNIYSLIIDPGYYTLDWAIYRGTTPLTPHIDSVEGGIQEVISCISTMLRNELGSSDISQLDDIDRALRNGNQLSLLDRTLDISNHVSACTPIINSTLNALRNNTGNCIEVSNIVVIGGGASLYLPAVKKLFPHHTIQTVPDPVFSNVLGFQLYGLNLMRERRSQETPDTERTPSQIRFEIIVNKTNDPELFCHLTSTKPRDRAKQMRELATATLRSPP